MAKYDVDYSCGHNATIQLVGPTRERERKIEWMERGFCPECFKSKKDAERTKAEAAAKEGINLVALNGSEKQIKWADSLRAGFLANIKKQVENAKAQNLADDNVITKTLKAVTATVNRHHESKFWIDNRDNLEVALDETYREEATKIGLGK